MNNRPGSTQQVDVICQHNSDGSMIPLQVRIRDDDGVFQTYRIKAYKDLTPSGSYVMPNSIPATAHTWQFECKIAVFSVEKRIRLFYNAYENFWRLDFVG